MKKIITVPVTSIELKTVSKPGSAWNGRQYFLITFRTGGIMQAKYRKTAVTVPLQSEQPEEYKATMDYFNAQITSKVFMPLTGSYFTIGDKSIDPNTIDLPYFKFKLSDGSLTAKTNSIEVFVLYNPEEDRYETSPQKKALSIIHNPELCELCELPGAIPQSGPDPL